MRVWGMFTRRKSVVQLVSWMLLVISHMHVTLQILRKQLPNVIYLCLSKLGTIDLVQ